MVNLLGVNLLYSITTYYSRSESHFCVVACVRFPTSGTRVCGTRMQVIPGTHKLGVAKRVYVPPYDYLHIDFDLINPMIDAGKVVDIEINPGDMLIFQNLLFHQGGVNHSGKLRWNADFRYQDARQPTLTSVNGHLVRSRAHPEQVISSREEWARMSWS